MYLLFLLLKIIYDIAKNLVENLLKFDPAQRITAKEILQHPWIHVILYNNKMILILKVPL